MCNSNYNINRKNSINFPKGINNVKKNDSDSRYGYAFCFDSGSDPPS